MAEFSGVCVELMSSMETCCVSEASGSVCVWSEWGVHGASRDWTRPASSRPENQTSTRAVIREPDQRRDALREPDQCRDAIREPDHVLERTGRNYFFSFLSSSFSGTVRSCVACSHWADRMSRLHLLAKDSPCSSPIGCKMTHSLIWRQARTKRFVSARTARTIPRAVLLLAMS